MEKYVPVARGHALKPYLIRRLACAVQVEIKRSFIVLTIQRFMERRSIGLKEVLGFYRFKVLWSADRADWADWLDQKRFWA